MPITFNIGPMGDPPTWRIWSFSADITTDSFMSTSGPSKWIRTADTPTESPMGRSTHHPSKGSIPDSENWSGNEPRGRRPHPRRSHP